jgi:hypothetical protein
VSGWRAALALALMIALGACSLSYDAGAVGVPVTLASPAGQPPAGDHFVVSSKALFGLWGLATLKQPSLKKALAAQLGGASAVANVRIRERSRFGDLLITVLTAGIIVPRTITFEGFVTK